MIPTELDTLPAMPVPHKRKRLPDMPTPRPKKPHISASSRPIDYIPRDLAVQISDADVLRAAKAQSRDVSLNEARVSSSTSFRVIENPVATHGTNEVEENAVSQLKIAAISEGMKQKRVHWHARTLPSYIEKHRSAVTSTHTIPVSKNSIDTTDSEEMTSHFEVAPASVLEALMYLPWTTLKYIAGRLPFSQPTYSEPLPPNFNSSSQRMVRTENH